MKTNRLEQEVDVASHTLAFSRFLGDRVQLAYVVGDLEAALRYWTETMRVGPFVVFERSKDGRTILYRGEETQVDLSLAFAYLGDVQIEIIQQLNDEPSPYKAFLDRGCEGLHHLGFWPKDFTAACAHVEANGFVEIYTVLASGKRNAVYYEAPSPLGSIIELVPLTEQRAAYFGRIQRVSQNWDGMERPVRRFAGRAEFLASAEGLGLAPENEGG